MHDECDLFGRTIDTALDGASHFPDGWREHHNVRRGGIALAPIYGWFTEGFDTADLQEVKALLEELS